MAPFYDAATASDLQRVEEVLRGSAIEYVVISHPGSLVQEVRIAEEDFSAAEAALGMSTGAAELSQQAAAAGSQKGRHWQ